MTIPDQKQEILRSLNYLDSLQAEKVLSYMKGLLKTEHNDLYRQHLRSKALHEIGRALQRPQPDF